LLEEIERLARALEGELGEWRRRCHRAEAELTELKAAHADRKELQEALESREERLALEAENAALKTRIAAALDQLETLNVRLRFIEERSGEPV
jgi:hypothetical protein